ERAMEDAHADLIGGVRDSAVGSPPVEAPCPPQPRQVVEVGMIEERSHVEHAGNDCVDQYLAAQTKATTSETLDGDGRRFEADVAVLLNESLPIGTGLVLGRSDRAMSAVGLDDVRGDAAWPEYTGGLSNQLVLPIGAYVSDDMGRHDGVERRRSERQPR